MNEGFPDLGVGIGLRAPHYAELSGARLKKSARLEAAPLSRPDWLEVISENFMGIGEQASGRPMQWLRLFREHFPIALHGVSLSIGSSDPLNRDYLSRLRTVVDEIQPCWVSDHLCWVGVDGANLHDLLPLPYDQATLRHVRDRVQQVQDFLRRPILIENVSSYFEYPGTDFSEPEFLAELCLSAGCFLLLDINNIYVSSMNRKSDPERFLETVPRDVVKQFHLAGHSSRDDFLVDTHDREILDEVWNLYERALGRFGRRSTLVERDENIPVLDNLMVEVDRARALRERVAG